MPEFTDDQLRYHAAKARFPANVLAEELLRVRGEPEYVANERITYFDHEPDKIDEVVMSNAMVHLEGLSDSQYMLIVENARHRWHLEIGTRSGRGKVRAWVLERSDEEDHDAD